MTTSGLEFNFITNQKKVNQMQIDINKNNKDSVIKKIKDLDRK